MLFALLLALSKWEGDYPFDGNSLIHFASDLLAPLMQIKDLCNHVLVCVIVVDRAKGSDYMEFSQRLAVLLTIEAHIYISIQVSEIVVFHISIQM